MSDSPEEDKCWYCGAKQDPTAENVSEKLHEENQGVDLPVAAKADYCENCGCLEAVWSTGNLSNTDKKPCADNKLQRINLTPESDAEDAVQAAIDKGVDRGFEKGKEVERQKILDNIEDKMAEYQGYIDSQPNETLRNKQIAVFNELRKLRDDLQEENQDHE